jgi:Rnl2 family RNA ligase
MIFKKYENMEQLYRKKFINQIIEEGFTSSNIMWVATEKVHGCNCSLWTDGIKIKIAKRNGFVKNTEDFYNSDKKILNKYKNDLLMIFKIINVEMLSVQSVAVYGELCGGSYPHKNVKPDTRSKKIQKGIYYNPKNDFLVFDIMVQTDQGSIYLNWDDVKRILTYTKFKLVPELAIANFDEIVKVSNDGDSQVYKLFNLPKIENNTMEGVVLKPLISSFLENGKRVIIKNKNDKWIEKSKISKHHHKSEEIYVELMPIVSEIEPYITENRLRNVLSHIGEVTNKDFGKINKQFVADIMESYIKENGNKKLNILSKEYRKTIHKMINKRTANLIRKNFINIIDNEF